MPHFGFPSAFGRKALNGGLARGTGGGVAAPSTLALVYVLQGQSNNTQRGTALSAVVNPLVFTPVGGNNLQLFEFYPTNAEWSAWDGDVASVVQHAEGAAETPLSGFASVINLPGHFAQAYIASVAIGSRSLKILGASGPRNNLSAVVHRLCDIARADGFEPVVVYDTMHGEAEMAAGVSESTYYDDGVSYYGMARLIAAQAMGDPSYVAPIIFRHPIEMKDGTDGATSRGIHKAISRLAADLPNTIYAGGSYHYDSEADRIHNEEAGMRNRGEHSAYLLNRFFEDSVTETPLLVESVVWAGGSSAVVTFNHNVVRDTNYDWGTNLNTSKALAGFEWDDNGTLVQVTGVAVSGAQVTLTLASTPAGTVGQQFLRVASQTTAATLVSGSNNRSGSQVRVDETGRPSIYSAGDPKYGLHYRWATPGRYSVSAP